MNCEESKNLITISVFGKLSASEKAQLESHIKECAVCANIFKKAAKLSESFNESEEITLPDREKSWQIISAKALKRKGRWLESFVLKKPVLQYSFALLLIFVGFAGGYFVHSGWQTGHEVAQLRQEVLQIREMTAASLIRQETLNAKLKKVDTSSPLFFLEDFATKEDLIFSLSEQTSPVVDIALILARHINQMKVY
jgi:hypothetical protein